MKLFIEITDGPLKGNRTPLRDGLTLGRSGCDVNIEDSKVSGKHARVEKRPDGRLWLIDTESANGIRVDGKRATELKLKQGTSFRLGRTHFQVLASGEAPKKTGDGKTWRDSIVQLSERAIRESEPGKRRESALLPFSKVLKLSFKRGMQSGTTWFLGYGPRDIGASSVDLPLFEPGLPGKCFRILQQEKGLVIRATEESHGKILLNGKRFESAFLKQGDVLDIENTRIEISFET